MIVICAGMQKSASASFYNLTNDLLVADGHPNMRELRARYHMASFMTEVNCNIGPLRAYKLLWLGIPHLQGYSFAVKTHEPPSPSSLLFLRLGICKASYIYRDPRDVAVSLFNHGRRIREGGFNSNTQFDNLTTIESAIRFVATLLPVWKAWSLIEGIHMVRYEDFVSDIYEEARNISGYLGLDLEKDRIHEIAARYDMRAHDSADSALPTHFHVGKSGRWKSELAPEHRELCHDLFGEFLLEMGYSEH